MHCGVQEVFGIMYGNLLFLEFTTYWSHRMQHIPALYSFYHKVCSLTPSTNVAA